MMSVVMAVATVMTSAMAVTSAVTTVIAVDAHFTGEVVLTSAIAPSAVASLLKASSAGVRIPSSHNHSSTIAAPATWFELDGGNSKIVWIFPTVA